MGIDAPNIQGTNLAQVIVTGDHAAQVQQNMHRGEGQFQSQLGMAAVEKALRARDQTDASDMVVKSQEDQAQFSSGDSLRGGGGGGGGSEEPRSSSDGDSFHEESDQGGPIQVLQAPFEVADRFRSALVQGGRAMGDRTFRAIDRRFLAGLLDQTA
jgi:hypothetical protein